MCGYSGWNNYGISIFLPDEVWWDLRYFDGKPYSNFFKSIYRYLDFSQQTSRVGFILTLYPEEGGWYAYWYDKNGVEHTEFVTSDPNKKDTDGDGLGDYEEWSQDLNPRDKDTDDDGMNDYYEMHYGKPAGGWQEPHYYNARYAVIMVGGGWNDPNEVDYDTYMPAFWNDGKAMYNKLVNDYHYSPSNVYLMSSRWYSKYDGSWGWRGHDKTTESIVDGEAMWDVPNKFDIKDALDEIASKITTHDSLFITIVTHGGPGGFGIRSNADAQTSEDHPGWQGESVSYSDFGDYINTTFGNNANRKYAVLIVVNQACYSGTMKSHLSGENRILISAADSTHKAWTEDAFQVFGIWLQTPYEHFAFIYQGRMKKLYENGQLFFPTYNGFILSMGNIGDPKSISYMYQKGDYAEHNNGEYYDEHYSYPMIVHSGSNPEKIYL